MKFKEIKFQRKQLYEELWTVGITKVSEKYDVPYNKLKEALKAADIPYPTSSYWSYISLEMFDKAVKIPLPYSSADEIVLQIRDRSDFGNETGKVKEIVAEKKPENNDNISKLDSNAPVHEISHDSEPVLSITKDEEPVDVPVKVVKNKLQIMVDELDFLNDVEKERLLSLAEAIEVKEHQHYLPIVKNYKEKVDKWFKNPWVDPFEQRKGRYGRHSDGMPYLCDDLGPESFPRVYRMMNALYKAVISLGGKVEEDMSVTLRGEKISFRIHDRQKQIRHQLTDYEREQLKKYGYLERGYGSVGGRMIRKYDYVPTGKLTFSIGFGGSVTDSGDELVESRLGEILVRFMKATVGAREARLAYEERQRLEQEKKQREEERRKRFENEKELAAALENEAADYEMACKIRNYIKAVESSGELTEEKRAWIKWASKKADWYDPTISAYDEVLGKRDHTKPNNEDTRTPPFWRYW